jgi:hypothetical protein
MDRADHTAFRWREAFHQVLFLLHMTIIKRPD